ncbi:cysteine desulfurase [Enteropsectra breve]|nr:cysteine desulfurase [Enteropsectra breve]
MPYENSNISKAIDASLNGYTKPAVQMYFDFQATTPLDPRVLDAMLPYAVSLYGNPHSRNHSYGWEAEKGVENARKQIADLINADSKEIVFASGATEATNMAIKGLSEYHNNKLHIITTQVEHKCVLETCRGLEEKGVEVTYLPVEKNGCVTAEAVRNAIRPNTRLVSVMAVNNEVGTISPLKEIGEVCKEKNIVFHTDAAQGFGKTPIDVKECNIGMMSISGHKIYGPKGIGALYIRRNPKVRILPIVQGGGQEKGLRSGTTPSFLAVGLGKAAEIAQQEMPRDERIIKDLRNIFVQKLRTGMGDEYIINGKNTVPGCLNISFPYVEGEGLLMNLKDFALSSGSACTSASLEPSYVLRALGASDDLAHSSIRFGFGRFTQKGDVEKLADKTVSAVNKLREMSPLYEMVKEGVDLKSIKWTA